MYTGKIGRAVKTDEEPVNPVIPRVASCGTGDSERPDKCGHSPNGRSVLVQKLPYIGWSSTKPGEGSSTTPAR